jgi:hypothetical protein
MTGGWHISGETAMHKIISIAVASIIALSSANAEQQRASKQQDENEPVATDAGPPAKAGESANRNAIIGVMSGGSAPPSAVSGTVFSQSGTRMPALVPMGQFVPYGVSDPAANEELQRQMQELHEREQRMLQNPEYRDLLRARQRVALSPMHADLPELLQISKEQAGQLLDLLAEQQVREQAASRPMWPGHGDAVAMQEFMEKAQERQRTNDAEIAALLGPNKLQEWKEYEQSAMARFQVQRLRQMLPLDVALRAEQLRPLVSAMSREQRQMFEDRALVVDLTPGEVPDEDWQKRMHERHLEQTSARNQRILDAASSILSPKQLEYLGSLLQQELDAQSRGQFFFGRMTPLAPSNPQRSKR